MYLGEFTGKGVRIAVIDSGVYAAHPHVGGVAGGLAVRNDGSVDDDYIDELGHGTAVTAAIREKAPAAEIIAIKVFERSLKTDIATLVRGIDEAAARGAELINLSLGTSNSQHRALLEDAVARARVNGALIVAANDDGGVRWLPGCLENVVAVRADWSCDRHTYAVGFVEDRLMLSTSAYPREIPGVPRERNLNGVSFAVANATGFVARAIEASRHAAPPQPDALARVFAALEQAGPERASQPGSV